VLVVSSGSFSIDPSHIAAQQFAGRAARQRVTELYPPRFHVARQSVAAKARSSSAEDGASVGTMYATTISPHRSSATR